LDSRRNVFDDQAFIDVKELASVAQLNPTQMHISKISAVVDLSIKAVLVHLGFDKLGTRSVILYRCSDTFWDG
jgi:hypothetical protein